jgi:hypothetical protein
MQKVGVIESGVGMQREARDLGWMLNGFAEHWQPI